MATLALFTRRVRASWLNWIEIYFWIIQRKILTPNDVVVLAEFGTGCGGSKALRAIGDALSMMLTRQDLVAFLARLAHAHRCLNVERDFHVEGF